MLIQTSSGVQYTPQHVGLKSKDDCASAVFESSRGRLYPWTFEKHPVLSKHGAWPTSEFRELISKKNLLSNSSFPSKNSRCPRSKNTNSTWLGPQQLQLPSSFMPFFAAYHCPYIRHCLTRRHIQPKNACIRGCALYILHMPRRCALYSKGRRILIWLHCVYPLAGSLIIPTLRYPR